MLIGFDAYVHQARIKALTEIIHGHETNYHGHDYLKKKITRSTWWKQDIYTFMSDSWAGIGAWLCIDGQDSIFFTCRESCKVETELA